MTEMRYIEALMEPSIRSSKLSALDPETRKARRSEQTKRAVKAGQKAMRALSHMYREDYAQLLAEARRMVDEEAGPLPGDAELTSI